jgi:hypothetical protein
MKDLVPLDRIISKIYYARNKKVMLDRDLAELYGVKTKVLKQAVRRNVIGSSPWSLRQSSSF